MTPPKSEKIDAPAKIVTWPLAMIGLRTAGIALAPAIAVRLDGAAAPKALDIAIVGFVAALAIMLDLVDRRAAGRPGL